MVTFEGQQDRPDNRDILLPSRAKPGLLCAKIEAVRFPKAQLAHVLPVSGRVHSRCLPVDREIGAPRRGASLADGAVNGVVFDGNDVQCPYRARCSSRRRGVSTMAGVHARPSSESRPVTFSRARVVMRLSESTSASARSDAVRPTSSSRLHRSWRWLSFASLGSLFPKTGERMASTKYSARASRSPSESHIATTQNHRSQSDQSLPARCSHTSGPNRGTRFSLGSLTRAETWVRWQQREASPASSTRLPVRARQRGSASRHAWR